MSIETSAENKIPNIFLYYISGFVVIKIPLTLVLYVAGVTIGLPNTWWMLILCFLIAALFNGLYDNVLIEMTSHVMKLNFKKKIAIELANQASQHKEEQ